MIMDIIPAARSDPSSTARTTRRRTSVLRSTSKFVHPSTFPTPCARPPSSFRSSPPSSVQPRPASSSPWIGAKVRDLALVLMFALHGYDSASGTGSSLRLLRSFSLPQSWGWSWVLLSHAPDTCGPRVRYAPAFRPAQCILANPSNGFPSSSAAPNSRSIQQQQFRTEQALACRYPSLSARSPPTGGPRCGPTDHPRALRTLLWVVRRHPLVPAGTR